MEKIFKYVFVACVPEFLIFCVFCLGTSVFNLLSLPYIFVPVIFVGSHRISCWFGEEEGQINDYELQATLGRSNNEEREYAINDHVEVRPAAYAFWLRGKVVADFDDPNIYSVRLSNGVLERKCNSNRMRRPLKRRFRGHRWMLTTLWIYNFILIFVRVSFQYAELPDTSCEHPSHYTVLLGLQKDIQRPCQCDNPSTMIGSEIFESRNFTFQVNSLTDHWTIQDVPESMMDTFESAMGTPQLSVDVTIFLFLLFVHAIIKTEAWGIFFLLFFFFVLRSLDVPHLVTHSSSLLSLCSSRY